MKRRAAGRRPVSIGVGVHYGEVFAGVVGEGDPLEFTVIGDAVNTARRIEELTKTTGWPMLALAELIAAAEPSPSRHFHCRRRSCGAARSPSSFMRQTCGSTLAYR
jgi:adenylate cyclase